MMFFVILDGCCDPGMLVDGPKCNDPGILLDTKIICNDPGIYYPRDYNRNPCYFCGETSHMTTDCPHAVDLKAAHEYQTTR
jgi:hypothetical protein